MLFVIQCEIGNEHLNLTKAVLSDRNPVSHDTE